MLGRVAALVFFFLAFVLATHGRSVSALDSSSWQEEEDDDEEAATTPLTAALHNNDRHKVRIELYYMPQCPGCRQLITTSFYEAFQTPHFTDMADVTFVPYGTTTSDDDNPSDTRRIFDNVLESCALHTIGRRHQLRQFSFVDCIDHYGARMQTQLDPHTVDRDCARAVGLSAPDVAAIERCAVSHEGHALAARNARQTDAVVRPTHFPWVVVNGHHTDALEASVFRSLWETVCGLYEGPDAAGYCADDDDEEEEEEEDDEAAGGIDNAMAEQL